MPSQLADVKCIKLLPLGLGFSPWWFQLGIASISDWSIEKPSTKQLGRGEKPLGPDWPMEHHPQIRAIYCFLAKSSISNNGFKKCLRHRLQCNCTALPWFFPTAGAAADEGTSSKRQGPESWQTRSRAPGEFGDFCDITICDGKI